MTLALAGCGSSKRPSDERAFCVVLDGANGTIRLTDLFAGEEVPTLAEIEKSAQVFSDLDQIAPTAIRPDTTEIVKFMKNDVQELLRLINETDSDDEAVAENASTQIEPYLVRVEKLDTHMANVAKYAKDRCGIELDNSTASN